MGANCKFKRIKMEEKKQTIEWCKITGTAGRLIKMCVKIYTIWYKLYICGFYESFFPSPHIYSNSFGHAEPENL